MFGNFVPEADIDASLLRGVEPFQMVQLVCRAARFWIAFVQSCDPYFASSEIRTDSAQEPLRHDYPRTSSSACTGRLE